METAYGKYRVGMGGTKIHYGSYFVKDGKRYTPSTLCQAENTNNQRFRSGLQRVPDAAAITCKDCQKYIGLTERFAQQAH